MARRATLLAWLLAAVVVALLHGNMVRFVAAVEVQTVAAAAVAAAAGRTATPDATAADADAADQAEADQTADAGWAVGTDALPDVEPPRLMTKQARVESERDKELLQSREEWLATDNVAEFLGLEDVYIVAAPVPLYVVFSGVDIIESKPLDEWFAHLDHFLPLSRVAPDRSSVKPSEHVMYSYVPRFAASIGLIRTAHSIAAKVLDAGPYLADAVTKFLHSSLRRQDDNFYYALSRPTELLLTDFATSLGLSDGYVLFIVRPNVTNTNVLAHSYYHEQNGHKVDPAVPIVYGYRDTMLQAELEECLREELAQKSVAARKQARIVAAQASTQPMQRGAASSAAHVEDEENEHLVVRNVRNAAKVWASKVRMPLDLQYGTMPEIPACRALLTSSDPVTAHQIISELTVVSEGMMIDGLFPPQCLADVWTGVGRIAWIDLAAGPSGWGPQLAGSGIKTPHQLPFCTAADCTSWETPVEMPVSTNITADELTADYLQVQLERVQGDIGLLQARETQECDHEAITETCSQLQARITVLQTVVQVIQAFQHDKVEATKDEVLSVLRTWLTGSTITMDVEHDARLSPPSIPLAVLSPLALATSRFVRQLLAVPTTMAVPKASYDSSMHADVQCVDMFVDAHTVASISSITFEVYVVVAQGTYDPLGPTYLDVAALQQQLSAIALDSQNVAVTLHQVNLYEDPAIALAYAASLRAQHVPVLSHDGRFNTKAVTYIDTAVFAHQILTVHNATKHAGTLVVPVFIFSLDEDEPVVVDERFAARAYCGVVVAVQSPKSPMAPPFSCNSKPITLSTRNPVRHVVQAAVEAVAGLLPVHMSTEHGKLSQQWLFALGGGAGSTIGWRDTVTSFQRDATHRLLALQAIEASAALLEEGMQLLRSTVNLERNFDSVPVLDLQQLQAARRNSENALEAMRVHLKHLNWDHVAYHQPHMLFHAKRFLALAKTVSARVNSISCAPVAFNTTSLDIMTLLLAAVVAAVVAVYRATSEATRKSTKAAVIN